MRFWRSYRLFEEAAASSFGVGDSPNCEEEVAAEKAAIRDLLADPTNPIKRQVRKLAKREREATGTDYFDMQKEIGRRKESFVDRQEHVFGILHMKHEACFAGKLNGNSVRELKESDIRPHEIPSPKDSVFLADVRSRQESSKALREQ